MSGVQFDLPDYHEQSPEVRGRFERLAARPVVMRVDHLGKTFMGSQGEVVALGYQWLQGPNWATAVALFELSSEQFPESALAQFHRGEAYRYTGQSQKAAEQYRRALELQPDHPTAAARLAEVSGE